MVVLAFAVILCYNELCDLFIGRRVVIFYTQFYERNLGPVTITPMRVRFYNKATIYVRSDINLNGRMFKVDDEGLWCVAYGCEDPKDFYKKYGDVRYKVTTLKNMNLSEIDSLCELLREAPLLSITEAMKFLRL